MNAWQIKTPIAFFIFNRPDTTEKVFTQIARARPAKLLVVADGPRPNQPGEAERCAAARAVIDRVDWDCEVLTNYARTNLGCKRRVSSGLDWVFDTVEEAIILEDDCLPHPDFFPFCAALLERYRTDERLMMIGGTNYSLKTDIPESYLFSRYFAIWGWATWRRAWEKYDIHLTDWETLRAQKHLRSIFHQPYVIEHFTRAFDTAYYNQIDTWDLQWFYCCLFNHGLSAVPRVNLITNIGQAGTHTLVGVTDPPLPTFALGVQDLRHPQRVFANSNYDDRLFEKRIKVSLANLVRRKIAALSRPRAKQK